MTHSLKNQKGFSFIEIMTTIAVLSLGIVAIYQSFFKSLEYVNHVTYRLHALNLLSNKIEMIQKRFEVTGEIVLSDAGPAAVVLHGRKFEFQQKINLMNVNRKKGIYQLDVSLSWVESGRSITLSRSCYIYNDNPKPS